LDSQRPLLPTDLSDTIIPVWRLEPGGSKTIQTTPSHHYQKSVDMLFGELISIGISLSLSDAAYIHPGWLFDDIWKNHCLPLVNGKLELHRVRLILIRFRCDPWSRIICDLPVGAKRIRQNVSRYADHEVVDSIG
jgi:hypothetical protein